MALVPKCPLCLAAYLSVIGVTAGAAVPWIRVLQPAIAIAAVLTLGAVVLRLARRARRYLPRYFRLAQYPGRRRSAATASMCVTVGNRS